MTGVEAEGMVRGPWPLPPGTVRSRVKTYVHHSICISCFRKLHPASRSDVRDGAGTAGPCCYCEGVHASGIWLRGLHDEPGTLCGGVCR
jgi:hypothetical protein